MNPKIPRQEDVMLAPSDAGQHCRRWDAIVSHGVVLRFALQRQESEIGSGPQYYDARARA